MRAMFVYAHPDNLRYTLIKGGLRDWLRDNGTPAMWSPTNRGWHVRTERIGDLIAQAERDGFRVHMKGILR